ncbi:MAG TPA: serine/threonine-protein kinase [Ktedonobacterales bacterium]
MQTSSDSRIGTTVDNYKLLSVLGAGSMSVVYLAQRLDDLRALVAVKLLHYQGLTSADDHAAFIKRFQREARAASQLRNEYILPVLASGEDGDLPYMVMPVIVGGTLATRLNHQPQPLPLGEIARYLNQLASAIDYAHAQGVVHRDIKPSNILLDEHGHVYLTDFGIARLFDAGDNALTRENAPTLTRTGQVLGTPYYMAPEQIQARPAGPAADIYALGVVVYQMVTGQVPFHGDTPLAIALQHLQEAPNAPGMLRHELPQPLEAVILRALAKNPADRYATAAEFAEAFQAGLADIDDPMATRAPSGTWPFSTQYAANGSTVQAMPAATPMPQARALPEKLVGLTIDGYLIGAVIEADDLGTVFTATRESSPESVRVRFLAMNTGSPKQVAGYLLQFEQQAHDLSALRHPNLASVIGYGAYEGQPYLITPDTQGIAESANIAQHGVTDLSTIADTLDQIVAGLEAAHRRGFLHLSLTADRVFRQDDGRVVVADVGVRGMLNTDNTGDSSLPSQPTSDACSPEQLSGGPVGAYTDVYALGVLLYHMLTGREVFTGATRDDIAQQHLHSTIPPLRRWRPSLPTALDGVVSKAMAKEPERRFQTPREVAVAYHTAVARTQHDASAMTPTQSILSRSAISATSAVSPKPEHATTTPVVSERGALATLSAASTSAVRSLSRLAPSRVPWLKTRRGAGASVIGAVLLVSIIASIFAWNNAHKTSLSVGALAAGPTGAVTFFDSTPNAGYNTDALKMSLISLPTLQKGHKYAAWLIDNTTDKVLPLGVLTLQPRKSKDYAVVYNGASGPGQPGANLLGFGKADDGVEVRITDEAQIGTSPSGPIVMKGAFPPKAFTHIQHLLVAFPTTPQHQGYLVGMMQQMSLLYEQANGLKDWIGVQYPKSTLCAAQSIVDIIEGHSGANYQPLGSDCNVGLQPWPAGDGYGLLGNGGYLEGVRDHVALAVDSPDANATIRMHSQHVYISIKDVAGWLQTIDQDAVKVLQGSRDQATLNEIKGLSQIALNGRALNGDETVNPVPGEAGAAQAYLHGQLLSTLTLTPTH